MSGALHVGYMRVTCELVKCAIHVRLHLCYMWVTCTVYQRNDYSMYVCMYVCVCCVCMFVFYVRFYVCVLVSYFIFHFQLYIYVCLYSGQLGRGYGEYVKGW